MFYDLDKKNICIKYIFTYILLIAVLFSFLIEKRGESLRQSFPLLLSVNPGII
jgi:hypothetical protein